MKSIKVKVNIKSNDHMQPVDLKGDRRCLEMTLPMNIKCIICMIKKVSTNRNIAFFLLPRHFSAFY